MTPGLVVDASVALKWLIDEPGSDQANELLDAHLDQSMTLAAPGHLLAEVGNGLRKLVARGSMDGPDAASALEDLVDLDIDLLDSTPVWPRTLEAALQWQVTTYDAVYVLTALDRGTDLVTADARLHTSCSPLGLPVRLI